jgi:hypothetical protein
LQTTIDFIRKQRRPLKIKLLNEGGFSSLVISLWKSVTKTSSTVISTQPLSSDSSMDTKSSSLKSGKRQRSASHERLLQSEQQSHSKKQRTDAPDDSKLALDEKEDVFALPPVLAVEESDGPLCWPRSVFGSACQLLNVVIHNNPVNLKRLHSEGVTAAFLNHLSAVSILLNSV